MWMEAAFKKDVSETVLYLSFCLAYSIKSYTNLFPAYFMDAMCAVVLHIHSEWLS